VTLPLAASDPVEEITRGTVWPDPSVERSDGAELLRSLEARAGIEPAHKGFAVLTSTRNPLINKGISVGLWLPKGVVLAPFGTLLATLMATTEPARIHI